MLNCREVTQLASESLDRKLTWKEHIGLRFHLMMCKLYVAPTELEKYLHEQIPMSKAMQVSVVEVKPEAVVLSARY